MKLIIDHLNEKISRINNGIQVHMNFSQCPGVYTTYSGYELLYNELTKLKFYKEMLTRINKYEPCACNKLIRLIPFVKEETKRIDGISIYKCKRCGKYFSR